MQQLSRVCMIAGHENRQIEYVCIYPECTLSRFACSKCLKILNHKHQQQDQSHVLDSKELYEVLQERIIKRQSGIKQTQFKEQNCRRRDYKRQFRKIMIEQLEKGMDQIHDNQQLNELLMKLRNNGFNQFDDIQLNILINIDKQDGDINTSMIDQSNRIIQNAIRIQEWCYSQQQDKSGLQQKIKDSQYKVITQDQVDGEFLILQSTISNDYKYIVSGGTEKKLKIWDYSNNTLVKSIQLDNWIMYIKFTDDSKFLYVGKHSDLYKFDVNNSFNETYKQGIHSQAIFNIFCITNNIILTCSSDKTIIKTDVDLKQQLLLIKAHDDRIDGLDYNNNLNMITSSSHDKSIKIWNGNNGQLVLEKQNAHNNNKFIFQVLFIIKTNQLISLDNVRTIIIWNINYENKLLEQQQQIRDTNGILNISLVLNQQYITFVCREYIKLYSIKGDYIRSFNHDIKEIDMSNLIQPQSMKAIIIRGKKILQIIKVDLDSD